MKMFAPVSMNRAKDARGVIQRLFVLIIVALSLNAESQQSSYMYDPPGALMAVRGTNEVGPRITIQSQLALHYKWCRRYAFCRRP